MNEPPFKKPVAKRTIKKTGSTFTPSIKDALSDKLKEEKEEYAAAKLNDSSGQQLNEPFTKDQFEVKWHEYLRRLNDRPALKAALSKIPEIVNEHQLKLEISNSMQNEEISKIKPDMIPFLRKELKNDNIELITDIVNKEGTDKRAYSEREKFQEMIKKNPNISLLAQKFGLSLDE